MRLVANVAGRCNYGRRSVPGDVSCRSWGRAAYFGMILRDIAFAAAMLSTAGCATLFNGFSQRIEVTSEPPGAEVFVGGELAGTTPTEVVVSRRAREREFRVVDESGNSEYRWVRSRMSERAWLNIFSGLFVGCGAWFRSAEDRLEGNIGVAIFGFMIPWAVDLALGGTHEFPHRLDFSPRSAVRREPGAQKPVGPVQSYRRVLRGDVQPPRRLDVAPALDVLPRIASGELVEGEPRAALRQRPGRSRWHRRRCGALPPSSPSRSGDVSSAAVERRPRRPCARSKSAGRHRRARRAAWAPELRRGVAAVELVAAASAAGVETEASTWPGTAAAGPDVEPDAARRAAGRHPGRRRPRANPFTPPPPGPVATGR